MISNLKTTNQRALKLSTIALLVISMVFSSAFAFSANSYGATDTEPQKEVNNVSTKAVGDGVISGVVKDKMTDAILTNASIYLMKYDDESKKSASFVEQRTSDNAGNYDFSDLDDGIYFINAHANDYAYFESSDITISGGNSITLNAYLYAFEDLSSISGVVSDSKGNPLKEIHVAAYRCSDRTGRYEMHNSIMTDDEGKYILAGLIPGKYKLQFSGNEDTYSSHFWEYADSKDNAQVITLGDKQSLTGYNTILSTTNQIRVKFNSAGGSNVSLKFINKNTAIGKLPTPTKKGYVFTGWYLSTLKINDSFVPTHNMELTAKWRTKSTNNKLKGISKSTGKLSPKFKSSKSTYKLAISSSKKSVKITPKLSDSKAKLQIKVGSGKYKSVKSAKVSVKKGKTKKVLIKVTAENGKAKVYTVKVKRAK